jgi:pyruvate kinase
MRRLRRIKILATLGPVSSDSATIRKLFEAGADVFRINMSHTPHDKMRELVSTIRNVESSYGRPIGILVDLQGPSCGSAISRTVLSNSTTARCSPSMPIRRQATRPASICPIRKS